MNTHCECERQKVALKENKYHERRGSGQREISSSCRMFYYDHQGAEFLIPDAEGGFGEFSQMMMLVWLIERANILILKPLIS